MLLLLVLVVQNGTTLDATTTARADGTTTTLDLKSATVTATIPSTRAAKEHVPQAPILIAAPAKRLKRSMWRQIAQHKQKNLSFLAF